MGRGGRVCVKSSGRTPSRSMNYHAPCVWRKENRDAIGPLPVNEFTGSYKKLR
jgi:hypothetical protein